jgi:hypothetical protein
VSFITSSPSSLWPPASSLQYFQSLTHFYPERCTRRALHLGSSTTFQFPFFDSAPVFNHLRTLLHRKMTPNPHRVNGLRTLLQKGYGVYLPGFPVSVDERRCRPFDRSTYRAKCVQIAPGPSQNRAFQCKFGPSAISSSRSFTPSLEGALATSHSPAIDSRALGWAHLQAANFGT